jgi:hypothetical protein
MNYSFAVVKLHETRRRIQKKPDLATPHPYLDQFNLDSSINHDYIHQGPELPLDTALDKLLLELVKPPNRIPQIIKIANRPIRNIVAGLDDPPNNPHGVRRRRPCVHLRIEYTNQLFHFDLPD